MSRCPCRRTRGAHLREHDCAGVRAVHEQLPMPAYSQREHRLRRVRYDLRRRGVAVELLTTKVGLRRISMTLSSSPAILFRMRRAAWTPISWWEMRTVVRGGATKSTNGMS